jgi:hemerythrin-like domain-containing protein
MNSASDSAAGDSQRFSSLTTRFHRGLAQLLRMHQEALLIGDLTLAGNVFDLFVEALNKHLDVENGILFPLHQTLVETSRWPLLVYEKEHDKLKQMVDRIRRDLLALPELHGRARRLAVLEALEYQRTFKTVMEHHEEREEQALLPEVDAFADSEIYYQAYAQVCLVWENYLQQITPHWQAMDELLA